MSNDVRLYDDVDKVNVIDGQNNSTSGVAVLAFFVILGNVACSDCDGGSSRWVNRVNSLTE
jgi:hypothetical protein